MPETYFHAKEVAKKLKVSMFSLYRMLDDGRGPPAFRVGNTWRIPCEKFFTWIENGGTPKELAGNRGRVNNGKHKRK